MRSEQFTRAIGRLAIAGLFAGACNQGDDGSDSFGSDTPQNCTPGEQRACACPGGDPDGVQVCAPGGGGFEACTGCGGGGTGSESGAPSTSTGGDPETSMTMTTDPTLADSSSDGGASGPYTLDDCVIDTPRNGSEVCDDTGFTVPDVETPNLLVCLEATGGQIYVSTNSAVDPNDGVMRCSGWELMGQNAWDHLDYVGGPLTCDAEQKSLPIDLSGYVGQDLWFGAHDNPAGGGNGTTACMVVAR
jgi:hypothetical protein